MHFIELLLGISCLIFITSIVMLLLNNFKSDLITNIAIVAIVVSLIIIMFGILVFIANCIMNLFIIWFANW